MTCVMAAPPPRPLQSPALGKNSNDSGVDENNYFEHSAGSAEIRPMAKRAQMAGVQKKFL